MNNIPEWQAMFRADVIPNLICPVAEIRARSYWTCGRQEQISELRQEEATFY